MSIKGRPSRNAASHQSCDPADSHEPSTNYAGRDTSRPSTVLTCSTVLLAPSPDTATETTQERTNRWRQAAGRTFSNLPFQSNGNTSARPIGTRRRRYTGSASLSKYCHDGTAAIESTKCRCDRANRCVALQGHLGLSTIAVPRSAGDQEPDWGTRQVSASQSTQLTCDGLTPNSPSRSLRPCASSVYLHARNHRARCIDIWPSRAWK